MTTAPRSAFRVESPDGSKVLINYEPTDKQLQFHQSITPNCIIEGSRGTGKSLCIRMDAHMRALAYPGYAYLILRRTMPELKKSHLGFMDAEMKAFGGHYHKTDNIAYYPNGSKGYFSHCEDEAAVLNLLSSQYAIIYFDEISTFTAEMIAKIGACVRVDEGSGLLALVRGGTNPIGVGASYVRQYYITKDVPLEENPDYIAADFEAIHTTLADNPHIDREQYIKRLSTLPEHIRRAWLDGEWIIEGAYFHDYKPAKEGQSWHVTSVFPKIKDRHATELPWMQVYRALDWGFSPDPCVCLWVAVLPNSRAFVLKERHWKSTPARQVAKDIKEDSTGLRIVDTYCDPTMFSGSEATDLTSIGDIFESNGVPLTKSKNDRAAAGFAIHEYLNTILDDGLPQIQIYSEGCPMLLRTLPEMRTDKHDPRKIANGNDHWTIALAYFCLGRTGVSRETLTAALPRWMKPKKSTIKRLGASSVR